MKHSQHFFSYTPLIPFCSLNYDSWTHKEAIEFLSWFVEQVPKRTEYIVDFISKDTSTPDLNLMGNRDKLIHIWRWFLSVAEIEPFSEIELATAAPVLKQFGASFCSRERLSIRTEYLMRDIGMLFAQLLLEQTDQLSWTVVYKPKTDLLFHHPVLTGFVMMEYTPPFHPFADPIHLVGVQGAKLLNRNKVAKETDLWEMFNKWVGWIPK